MRKLFPLVFLAAAVALTAASQSGRRVTTTRPTTAAPIQPPLTPEPEPKPEVATPALFALPEGLRARQIKTLDNGSFRFADFDGKVVVINLWASWCGPCRREIPDYEKVRKAYAGREVEFIGLTTEDPRTAAAQVNKFVREIRFGFRLGWADRETARTLMDGKDVIPQTLVLDTEGRIISHWSGYSAGRSGDRLRQTIDHALETAPRT